MTFGFVYILRCKDNSLYTGWCKNLERRLKLHNEGKAAKYTRAKGPCKLVYFEEIDSKSEALKREIAIKKLSKAKKEDLVRSFNLG